MRRFSCFCGASVGFEHTQCNLCGARLAYDVNKQRMRSLSEFGDQWRCLDNSELRNFCVNGNQYGVCNWLAEPECEHGFCFACGFNRTIPNQSLAGNQQRWHVLERAKKRLFVTLLQLDLPLQNGWRAPDKGLLLDFIEDQRSQPDHYPETFVSTGYAAGVITINTLEADDIQRMAVRRAMNEPYRTVLGHMRHESGHYYWGWVLQHADLVKEVERLFGNMQGHYDEAIDAYYKNGAKANWQNRYISAYASAHPVEDWAETWGHYLHIYDALDTAYAHGQISQCPGELTMAQRLQHWCDISVVLNELNRSIGLDDAYPFLIGPVVQDKLALIDKVVVALRQTPQLRLWA